MHRGAMASPHLVPVVACELELGTKWHAHLCERHQVVEACFTHQLLTKKPGHLQERRVVREPVEERISLAGSVHLESLEPGDERLWILGSIDEPRLYALALGFDEHAFFETHLVFAIELGAPVRAAVVRQHAPPVERS